MPESNAASLSFYSEPSYGALPARLGEGTGALRSTQEILGAAQFASLSSGELCCVPRGDAWHDRIEGPARFLRRK